MSWLTDIIPAKYRKYVYAVGALAALGYGVYETVNGDWRAFVPAFAGALLSALAHANTSPTPGEGNVGGGK